MRYNQAIKEKGARKMNKEFEGNRYTQTENDHAGAENTGAGNIPDQGKKKAPEPGKK